MDIFILTPALAPVNTVGYGSGMDDKMNRQSWFDAGFEQLAAHGPQGLRVMAIARQLGVTKGSFYWHFKNLREYRAALMTEWERRYTHQIIQQVERAGGDAAAKLRRLMSVSARAASAGPRITFALRLWAMSDPRVGKIVARVDDVRLAYLTNLLCEIGWGKRDAMTLARFAQQALVGRLVLSDPPLSEAQNDLIFGALTPR
jgi:AcrR family transcriptional regulator